jgi:endonuclease YncB( thermonuclease family)
MSISALLSLSILISASPAKAESCQHQEDRFECVEFLRNYDADTITFNIPGIHPLFGSKISVRMRGIDAAEMKTTNFCERKASKIAKDLVATTLKNAKRIDLKNIDRDKYFRILADVIVDGQSLSETLLSKRLAVSYDGGKKSRVNWCKMLAEENAQTLD